MIHITKQKILALILSASIIRTESFLLKDNYSFYNKWSTIQQNRNKIVHSYSMFDEVSAQFLYQSPVDHTFLSPMFYQQEATEVITQAQATGLTQVHANPEITQDMMFSVFSHIIYDLSFFAIAPENTVLLRFVEVLGKLFEIERDYIPGNDISPLDLIFQFVMTGTYVSLFAKSILPNLQVFISEQDSFPVDHRDVAAFDNLFEPAGFTWMQYKALVVIGALEWIEMNSENVSELNDHINIIDNDESNLHWYYNSSSESFECSEGTAFACAQFVQKMKNREHNCVNRLNNKTSRYEGCPEQGATLLRVNTEKVMKMMENDEGFSMSMMFLAVNCLQEECLLE